MQDFLGNKLHRKYKSALKNFVNNFKLWNAIYHEEIENKSNDFEVETS